MNSMTREEAINEIKSWDFLEGKEIEAIHTLIPELRESEEERIRKGLVKLLTVASEVYLVDSTGIKKDSYLAYLEKQKDLSNMIVVSPEVWDNAIADAYENGKKDGEKQKEQKLAEKQDYSGLNDLERAIHHGFLSAGVENVPVTVIKETAKECLAQMKPVEWSEEDEEMLNSCISSIEEAKENRYAYKETDGDTSYDHEIDWLKSFRPSWKPSEEEP